MGNAPDQTSFFRLYFRHFYQPLAAQRHVLARPDRAGLAALAVLVPAIGYTVFYILAWRAGGAPTTFTPWLAIAPEDYFRFDIYVVAACYFGCWAFASGVTQLVSRLIGGTGSFEATAAVIGFAIGVVSWSTMLHDLIDATLGATGLIDMASYEQLLNEPTFWRALLWTLFAIYFVGFVGFFAAGLRRAHGFGIWRALAMSIVALASFQGLFLVFIR